jgi:glycosyltransferase involved in cell wall biosynthesis
MGFRIYKARDLGHSVSAVSIASPSPRLRTRRYARSPFMIPTTVFMRFVNLKFETQPDIFHCTYQMPLHSKSACNIYTIHDLVPLRLPFTTEDNKKFMYRLLQRVATKADHIVTVSENSKNDIMKYLGVEGSRITNTYETVEFPREFIEKSIDVVAEELQGSFGLEYGKYLLFYGALEPKKMSGG